MAANLVFPLVKIITDLNAADDDGNDDEFQMVVAAALELSQQRNNIVKINGYFENVNIYHFNNNNNENMFLISYKKQCCIFL